MYFNESKTSIPESRKYRIRLEGANGADPENELGQGVAVTRTGEGEYLVTWAKNPGTFVGWSPPAFWAATPGDLKGYTAVRDTYDTSAFTLAFIVYNSSFSAADLIVNQGCEFEVEFAETTAIG
jgi:hypothetical protein